MGWWNDWFDRHIWVKQWTYLLAYLYNGLVEINAVYLRFKLIHWLAIYFFYLIDATDRIYTSLSCFNASLEVWMIKICDPTCCPFIMSDSVWWYELIGKSVFYRSTNISCIACLSVCFVVRVAPHWSHIPQAPSVWQNDSL